MVSHWTRREAASGLVFVVLIVATNLIAGGLPAPDDSAAEIAAYFVEHRGRILTAAVLTGLAVIAFLWFAGVLRSVLRRWGEDAERLASLSFGAAVAVSALQLVGAIIHTALAYDAGRTERRYLGDAATVSALYDVGALVIYTTGFPLLIFVGAAALAMLRTGALPAWLGWLGMVVVVVNLLTQLLLFVDPDGPGGLALIGLLAFLVLLVWVAATSMLLLRRDGGRTPVAA